jgi:acyl-CoA thioesterase-1
MSVLIRKILLGLLLSFITLPALAENTILVLGDSLSAAYGLKPEQGWSALLQKRLQKNLLPYRVANDSVSGDTTSNGLVRLPFALVSNHPVITIIELGANDGLRGLSLDEIRKNLKAMIAMCKSAHSKVVLVGIQLPPNYGPEYTAQFQAIYTTLTIENKISLVPSLLAGFESDRKLFQEDGLHPVASAQNQMLDNVWVVLKPLLKS